MPSCAQGNPVAEPKGRAETGNQGRRYGSTGQGLEKMSIRGGEIGTPIFGHDTSPPGPEEKKEVRKDWTRMGRWRESAGQEKRLKESRGVSG